MTAETDLAHVRLDIEDVPFIINCNDCGESAHNPNGFMVCPHCGATDTVVLSGNELHVTEIEVAEEAPV
jgi:Zn finger protein HypA/HybF involved in hydrogenase expression